MGRQHLIFFLLSVLAWTSETSCSFIRIPEDLIRTEVVEKHEGDTLEFPCSSSNSLPGGELQWWTYNPLLRQIHSNGTRVFTLPKENNGQRSVVLNIENLQPSDSRMYHCINYRNGDYVQTNLRIQLKVVPKGKAVSSVTMNSRPSDQNQFEQKDQKKRESSRTSYISTPAPEAAYLQCWVVYSNGSQQVIDSNDVNLYKTDYGRSSVVLDIRNQQLEGPREYYCVDNRGERYVPGRLELEILPKDLPAFPAPVYLSLRIEPPFPVEGDTARVVCTLNLTMGPLHNLLWSRYTDAGTSEVIVPTSSDFSRFSIESNSSETTYEEILTIKDLQLSDARDYGCNVISPPLAGLKDHAFVVLSVTPKH